MKKKRLAFLGCGFLNGIIADAMKKGYLSDYELVGALGMDREQTEAFGKLHNCKPCHTIEELMDLKPDFTTEAASPQAIREHAEIILRSGSNLVALSIAHFTDKDFYNRIKQAAKENNTRLYVASGAVGGFDVIRTAALMSPIKATITSFKTPDSLYYSPFYKEGLQDITEPERVYSGKVKEAVEMLPFHFNVAVATSLASNGPENTNMNIDVVPNFSGDQYKIEIQGEEIATDINIYSKTYRIAAWSVIAVLENAVASIVF